MEVRLRSLNLVSKDDCKRERGEKERWVRRWSFQKENQILQQIDITVSTSSGKAEDKKDDKKETNKKVDKKKEDTTVHASPAPRPTSARTHPKPTYPLSSNLSNLSRFSRISFGFLSILSNFLHSSSRLLSLSLFLFLLYLFH